MTNDELAAKSPPAAATPVLLAAATRRLRRETATLPCRHTSRPCRTGSRRLGAVSTHSSCALVPEVHKAVKWNSPFYGIEDQGWFLNFHCFTKYVKVAFFRGTSLRPLPPGESKSKDARYLDIYENDQLDEELVASWIRQAAELPGWVP